MKNNDKINDKMNYPCDAAQQHKQAFNSEKNPIVFLFVFIVDVKGRGSSLTLCKLIFNNQLKTSGKSNVFGPKLVQA